MSENLNQLAFTPIYMKYSWLGGISMVEKPPLHIYDIYLEVEANGGHGGIWRPFYLSHIYTKYNIVYLKSIPYILLFLFSGWCITRIGTKRFYKSWFRICMPNSGGTGAEEIRICRNGMLNYIINCTHFELFLCCKILSIFIIALSVLV